jgi:hypothetical protein
MILLRPARVPPCSSAAGGHHVKEPAWPCHNVDSVNPTVALLDVVLPVTYLTGRAVTPPGTVIGVPGGEKNHVLASILLTG